MSSNKTIEVPANAGQLKCPNAFKMEAIVISNGEDVSDKTFKLNPYSGQVFSHWYWGKLAFDISGMSMAKEVIPCLKDHDTDQIVGAINKGEFTERVDFEGVFEDTDSAREVLKLKHNQWECSLAFDLTTAVIEYVPEGSVSEVNGEVFQGEGHIIRQCAIYETSFTLFGAVPNTQAQTFKKPINIFLKESKMSDEAITQEQLDKASLQGEQASVDRFQSLEAVCPDNPALVNEHFKKGTTVADFQNIVIADLRTQLQASKEELEKFKANKEEGHEPANFQGGGEGGEPESFMDLVEKFAKEKGCSKAKAVSEMARLHPKAHQAFIKGGQK